MMDETIPPDPNLRDYFAASALKGLLAALAYGRVGNIAEWGLASPQEAADAAYQYADAMLARRSPESEPKEAPL